MTELDTLQIGNQEAIAAVRQCMKVAWDYHDPITYLSCIPDLAYLYYLKVEVPVVNKIISLLQWAIGV